MKMIFAVLRKERMANRVRLINADAIFPWYMKTFGEKIKPNEVRFSMLDISSNLDNIPTAGNQPVSHGRWEVYQVPELGQAWTVQCSVCHAIGFHGKTPYCCECGSRMDGK